MTRTRAAAVALTTAIVLGGAGPAAGGTAADEPARASVTATLDGEPAEGFDVSDPLPLRPDRELAVEIEVTNESDEPLTVRSVRIDGRVLGVTFLDYDTRVDAVVEPGETVDRSYSLDLGRLGEQAIGLLPVELSVLDQDREPVASVPVVVDARGSLTSAYGLFGMLVGIATALLLGAALVRLARGTLPEHRWYRAVRFAVPGAGVGLTVAVTLSVMRVMVPDPSSAVTIVVACALAGLVLGFLTPHPDGARPEPSWSGVGEPRAGVRPDEDGDAGPFAGLGRDEPGTGQVPRAGAAHAAPAPASIPMSPPPAWLASPPPPEVRPAEHEPAAAPAESGRTRAQP